MQSDALTRLTIRQATIDDAARLSTLARSTFVDTFGADNTPDDMAMYVAASFGDEIQRTELMDPRNVVFLAEQGDEAIGYAMLRDGPAPDAVPSANVIEIDRLYVSKHCIGTGAGAILMQRCLDEAAARGKEVVWLNVWERNLRAIRFYERWKFDDVGTMPYILGTDCQTDRVMVRRVEGVSR